MALYQFELDLPISDSYTRLRTICGKTCAIVNETPRAYCFGAKTKFRIGKAPLTFAFTIGEREGRTFVTVSTDGEMFGELADALGGAKNTLWDLSDREFSDIIDSIKEDWPDFPLESGKPYMVSAILCDDGMGQESVTQGRNVSIGRATVGGALFGSTGALIGGMSGKKKSKSMTRSVFTNSILVQIQYSNGRIVEKAVRKKSKEYAEVIAKLK